MITDGTKSRYPVSALLDDRRQEISAQLQNINMTIDGIRKTSAAEYFK